MSLSGSSPRAWGTQFAAAFHGKRLRFIPTRVGNTEHKAAAIIVQYGSSPRAWGTRVERHLPRHQIRFIPTRVGNTWCRHPSAAMLAVHPHARGEHLRQSKYHSAIDGSSPRAWGTHRLPSWLFVHSRFIPTRVGNTSSTKLAICPFSVHPHARGEHISTLLFYS